MKVLIKKKAQCEHLLVKLTSNENIKEVIKYVNRGMYPKAIRVAIEKGKVLMTVREADLAVVEANLIITETQVHFDLLAD